jgi:hypoxanthine phosphoribosyltransferase
MGVIVFSKDIIQKRVCEVAFKISEDFKGKEVLIIAVLNGSFIFCADLVRSLNLKFVVDFVSLSSYSEFKSKGTVRIVSKFKESIIGKNVLILEDIVDTGITLDFLIKKILLKKPNSIKTCVLLDKKCMRKKEVPVEYSCFEINNDFVVGYGLDYNGFFRGLPYIVKLKGVC